MFPFSLFASAGSDKITKISRIDRILSFLCGNLEIYF